MTCSSIRADAVAERYFFHELEDQERDAYEEHIFACPECFAELESLRLAAAALGEQKAEYGAAPPRAISESRGPATGSRTWMWAAAAVLALVVAGAAWFGARRDSAAEELARHTPAQVEPKLPVDGSSAGVPVSPSAPPESLPSDAKLLALARYDAPRYQAAVLRGSAPESPFATAMRLYQAKNYRAAAVALQALPAADRDSVQAHFYLGACLLMTGNAARAETVATRLIGAGDSPYLEETYWLRAKARFASRNWEAGREDLRKLIALKGDWERRASQLLTQSLEIR